MNSLQEALHKLKQVRVEYDKLAKYALPKILSASNTIRVLTSAAKMQDKYGHGWGRMYRANLETLKRPPFVLTIPTIKKNWTPEEIENFYKTNPMLKV